MENYIVRIWSPETGVRGLACVTTGIVAEAARRHQVLGAGVAALGYGITAAALLGALLKVQQHVALKVEGNGPLRRMVVESDSNGHLRGYITAADPAALLAADPNDVATVIGQDGRLTVVKDLRVKELYKSVVPLQTGRLDADLTYYLMMSEQVPSFVEIGAPIGAQGRLRAAGGVLLQLLPDGDLRALAQMAERLDDLPPVGELLANGETPRDLLTTLFRDQEYELLETQPLAFRCTCSRQRSRQALKLLGRDEVAVLLAEGEAIIDCHFCHERYRFAHDELRAIIDEIAAERAREAESEDETEGYSPAPPR